MMLKKLINEMPKALLLLFFAMMALGLAHEVQAGEIEVIASTQDTNLIDGAGNNVPDGSGDGIGDIVFTSIAVGEGSDGDGVNDANQSRGWLPFVLASTERTAIATAGKVELQLFHNLQSNVPGVHVGLWGYEKRDSVFAVIGDYESTDTKQLVDSAVDENDSAGNFYKFDVTDFVKTEAGRSSNSAVIFQLRIKPTPADDGLVSQYLFVSADNNYLDGARKPRLIITPADG